MRTVVLALLLVGCERTISSDADCQAWADPCSGCVQQCTAKWDVAPDDSCDVDCLDPLPACIADGGTCVFAD
ncbi:MAG: hypothetical protein R3F61_00355 [Myxococcota bacterium]